MRRQLGILVNLILLAIVARGADVWATDLLRSVETYRSPLMETAIPPLEPRQPLVDRVVLVIVNGLGEEVADDLDLPARERLIDSGASASTSGQFPAGTSMARATLLTGAGPALNDAPIDVQDLALARPLQIDGLPDAARQQGQQLGLAGPAGWTTLFPDAFQPIALGAGQDAAADDAVIVGAALSRLAGSGPRFILIELNQVNDAVRQFGPNSPEFSAAARQADAHLDLIARRLDLDRATLMVIWQPGYVTRTSQTTSVPSTLPSQFLMLGRRVIPGRYSDIEQTDVAPTIAALLGWRLPTASQGRPLLEMLRLEEQTGTQLKVDVAAQRLALAEAYLQAVAQPHPLDAGRQDLATAQSSLARGNFRGAARLAELLAADLSEQMAQAGADRLAAGRRGRAPLLAAGLALALIFLWWRRARLWLVTLIAALVALAMYHGLYQLQRGVYSLYLIDSLPAFTLAVDELVWIGLGVGALLLALILILQREGNFWAAVGTGYSFASLVTLGFAAPALFGYWQHGALVTWLLPDGTALFWHFSSLRQAAEAATWGLLLPWPLGLLAWSLARGREFVRSRRRPNTTAGAAINHLEIRR